MEEEKYAIQVEWYDELAGRNQTFTLFYYTADQSVEMVSVCLENLILTNNLFKIFLFYS